MTVASSQQVAQQLLQRSWDRGVQFGLVFSWYVVERLVHRLEQSGHRERLLLDGDLLVHAFTGKEPPVEWRACLRWRPEAKGPSLSAALRAVCGADGGDEVKFDAEVAVSEAGLSELGARRFKAVATARLCGVACPVPLCIYVVEDEYAGFRPRDTSFSRLIDTDRASRPMSLAPELLFARRVRDLWEAGVAHLSPQTYLDLHRLVSAGVMRESTVVHALGEVFIDARPAFPPEVPLALSDRASNDKDMRQNWRAFQQRVRVPEADLGSIVEALGRYISPLLEAAQGYGRS